jgi:fumarylacetoacetate (FAA) hydrolase
MKLATQKNKTRDGQLVVVSQDLTRCVTVASIAETLQFALDNWSDLAPELDKIYQQLNQNNIKNSKPFHQEQCESPLPRAYQWADGSAYLNHVELVRKARGADVPDSFWHDPLMYQGGSDSFIGPRDELPFEDEAWGIDFEAEIAVITNDVPMGVSSDAAAKHIKLVLLVNDVSLRNLIPGELGKGFGFFQSKPSSAFSPVCVTPDELGESWADGKLHKVLNVDYNNSPFGRADAGQEMTFSFNDLVAHAAKSRPLGAGTLVGSGTVSNKLEGGPGLPVSEGGRGYSCIAEIRMIETINNGKPSTEFMKFGDRIEIEILDDNNQSIFGRIDQVVTQYKPK